MSTNLNPTTLMRNERISTEILNTIEHEKNLKKITNSIEMTTENPENSNQFPSLNQNEVVRQPSSSSSNGNLPNNGTRSYYSAVTNLNSTNTRVQKLIKMRIIPPFTREHLQNPGNFDRATNECYVAILRSFSPRIRPKITISKTHTIMGSRKLQTLMVTAPIEAEEEVATMQLTGLQILNRTIFPTADEVWRYSPSLFPMKVFLFCAAMKSSWK